MKKGKLKQWLLYSHLLFCFGLCHSLKAQLNTVFQEQFDKILRDALRLSPGEHGNHFIEAADKAATQLSPALNRFIAKNINSFPLSATSAGVSFDFSTGTPISIIESLGPIFAETAKTLGKGKINFGFNYTLLNPSKIRGLNTSDIRFAFTHVDVSEGQGAFLGTSPNESDVLDMNLEINLDASIFAFYLTAGITNNLDLSIAIPVINLTMSGDIFAVMNSFTWVALGEANHLFGGDGANPDLDYESSYSSNAAGIGDMALRLKYRFLQSQGISMAMLIDARLPTGDESNFLGTGSTNVRFSGIFSRQIKDFTPHLNVGYDLHTSEGDSDEIEFALGFDQKIVSGLTFAFDVLGEIEINEKDAISLFPGTTFIEDRIYEEDGTTVKGTILREIPNSNIPDNINDNVFNAAFGFRYAPSDRVQFLGNLLVPLNDGGLRPKLATTIGLAITL